MLALRIAFKERRYSANNLHLSREVLFPQTRVDLE